MSDGLGPLIEALVHKMLRRRNAALEQACEAALQGGQHGVLVTDHGGNVTAEVSPDVPYGYIHEINDTETSYIHKINETSKP